MREAIRLCRGVKNHFDEAMGMTYLAEIRAAYVAYEGGSTPKKIEMTEGGWTLSFVDASTQAQNVRVLYDALRGTPYVGRGYWFGVQDIPEGGLFYGLYDGDGQARASLTAYQQATSGPPPLPPPLESPPPQAARVVSDKAVAAIATTPFRIRI